MTITRREVLAAAGALVAGAAGRAGTTDRAGATGGAGAAGEAGTASTGAELAKDAPARPWSLPPKRPFQVIENTWIPLQDGTRLGVRLWVPEGSAERPVPVVWEYLPYRKRDDLRERDDATAQNLAPYGIAFARVDIRGTGDSDGVMTDEYA
jgi:hypothetical protein